MTPDLEALFPGLRGTTCRVTSPPDPRYNCVAWAAGDSTRWWWPDAGSFWPESVGREETVAALTSAFGLAGYELCAADDEEGDFGRVALFADSLGRPTHVARQLTGTVWTSKLGELVDIEHELHALAGAQYGTVAVVLRRPMAP